MAIPDYIQFNELGTEPWSYIGVYPTSKNAVINSAIHKVQAKVDRIVLTPVVTSTIIHYQYSPIIIATIVFPISKESSGIHKVYAAFYGDPNNVYIYPSIHRQGNAAGINAPVRWACNRYLNTPYESRYLETPCLQY